MFITVNGAPTYCYTGGKLFDAAKPSVIFIHGVLNDHSVWALQSRYLANHGWNVFALDLPGHCKSGGPAPASVQEAADFVAALVDALALPSGVGAPPLALVGHSWGSLIALQANALLQDRVSHLVLVGTAYPMKVSPALLNTALNEPHKAIEMINIFSRSTLAAPPSALGPGTWVHGLSSALNRRVLASNKDVNLFHLGFQACNQYQHGEAAMAQAHCPVLFILGEHDQMTPAAAAQTLVAAARAAGRPCQLEVLAVGHHLMNETPDQTLQALRRFLDQLAPNTVKQR